MKTSTILAKALNKLRNGKNWFKGSYTNGRGHYCIFGAVNKVSSGDPTDNSKGGYSAMESIQFSLGNGVWPVEFNDSDSTTFGDIKRVLKAAIKRERANGN